MKQRELEKRWRRKLQNKIVPSWHPGAFQATLGVPPNRGPYFVKIEPEANLLRPELDTIIYCKNRQKLAMDKEYLIFVKLLRVKFYINFGCLCFKLAL